MLKTESFVIETNTPPRPKDIPDFELAIFARAIIAAKRRYEEK